MSHRYVHFLSVYFFSVYTRSSMLEFGGHWSSNFWRRKRHPFEMFGIHAGPWWRVPESPWHSACPRGTSRAPRLAHSTPHAWGVGGGARTTIGCCGCGAVGGRGDDDGGEMKLVWGQNIFVARPSHQSHVAVPIAGFHFHLPLRRVLFTHAHLRNK